MTKMVRFHKCDEDIINKEIVTAPHFEEHLLMELYVVREHLLDFFNLTLYDLITEERDHEHPDKILYVDCLHDFLLEHDINLNHRIDGIFHQYILNHMDNYKNNHPIRFDFDTKLYILYVCVKLYFWNYESCRLIEYNAIDHAQYPNYIHSCKLFYQEIQKIIYPEGSSEEDSMNVIHFVDGFFVCNFGAKCSLLG